VSRTTIDVVDWFVESKESEIYDRQLRSKYFDRNLLERLKDTFLLVPGCGALGTAISWLAVRMGVRRLRVVDHDFSQPSNYPRTSSLTLYDSLGAVPKVLWCKRMLEAMHPKVEVEAVFTEISPYNAMRLLDGIDVVMDGLDNVHTRRVIAYYAYKAGVPFIYSGVEDVFYQVIPSIPGRTPCVSCLIPGETRRSRVIPVFAATVFTAASTAIMTMLRIVAGEHPVEMIVGDVYTHNVEKIKLGGPEDCECEKPSTRGQIVFVEKDMVKFYPRKTYYIDTSEAEKLCGRIAECTNTVVTDWFFRMHAANCVATVYLDGRIEAPRPCDWLLRKLKQRLRLE